MFLDKDRTMDDVQKHNTLFVILSSSSLDKHPTMRHHMLYKYFESVDKYEEEE
jgi:hypothetical protein